MEHRTPTTRERGFEAALWVVVILLGGFVLLPSLIAWLHGGENEQVAERIAQEQLQKMHKAAKDLEWVMNDPLADQQLQEMHHISTEDSPTSKP